VERFVTVTVVTHQVLPLRDVELSGRVRGWMDAESAPWTDPRSRRRVICRRALEAGA
jgi:hypothetical protein